MRHNINKIGFIGAGKVGVSFGRHIKEYGGDAFAVAGYFSRDTEAARSAAAFTGSQLFDTAKNLTENCDLLLLTIPDDQITGVWENVSDALPEGRERPLYVGHCSGSLDACAFETKPPGLAFGSIHPILAVYDKEKSYRHFPGAYFTIEGDADFAAFAEKLLKALGNPYARIDASVKTRYHAASVFVSNLVCALAYTGTGVFKSCGLNDEFAENAWRLLFLGNAKNIAAAGPIRALTGPVERGDAATIAKHLEALPGDTRELYRLLSEVLTEAARQKNPARDYTELAALFTVPQKGSIDPSGERTACWPGK